MTFRLASLSLLIHIFAAYFLYELTGSLFGLKVERFFAAIVVHDGNPPSGFVDPNGLTRVQVERCCSVAADEHLGDDAPHLSHLAWLSFTECLEPPTIALLLKILPAAKLLLRRYLPLNILPTVALGMTFLLANLKRIGRICHTF